MLHWKDKIWNSRVLDHDNYSWCKNAHQRANEERKGETLKTAYESIWDEIWTDSLDMCSLIFLYNRGRDKKESLTNVTYLRYSCFIYFIVHNANKRPPSACYQQELQLGLTQGGITTRDWFSEQELSALAISMVTRMERAIVMASGARKISQEIPLKFSASP